MYVLELAGEDDQFAALEATNAGKDITVPSPGIGIAAQVAPSRVRGLAYTRCVSELVGRTDASPSHVRELVASDPLDRSGTVAVRVRDIRGTTGIDSQRVERLIGQVLVDRGFHVDLDVPDNELRVLFSGSNCYVGWYLTESERGFGGRAPTKRPFFQPGSMSPMDARAIVNIARAGPDMTIVDPMCGTGGLLIEAGLLGSAVVGIDVQRQMVEGTKMNLTRYLPGNHEVVQGDAGQLPLCGSVDALVFDAPYGRQSKIADRDNAALVRRALDEAKQVTDRCVGIGDTSWSQVATETGWHVDAIVKRRVHQSLTRYIHVLTPREQSRSRRP